MSDNSIDWPGLLKWSLAYHDGTRETDLKEMKEEDRQFIINAMDSMIMDEVKRIRILLEVLRLPDDPERLQMAVMHSRHALRALEDQKNLKTVYQMREAEKARQNEAGATTQPDAADARAESTSSPSPSEQPYVEQKLSESELAALVTRVEQEKTEALEELMDRVAKVDNSNGLVKLGGLPILRTTLRSSSLTLRALAAQVLATIVQNNPEAQNNACNAHMVQTLLSIASLQPIADASSAATAAAATVGAESVHTTETASSNPSSSSSSSSSFSSSSVEASPSITPLSIPTSGPLALETLVSSASNTNSSSSSGPSSSPAPFATPSGPFLVGSTWTDSRGKSVSFSPLPVPRNAKGHAVIKSALYALSSLLENCPAAQAMFVANNGVPIILSILSSGESASTFVPVRRRAVSLLLVLAESRAPLPAADFALSIQLYLGATTKPDISQPMPSPTPAPASAPAPVTPKLQASPSPGPTISTSTTALPTSASASTSTSTSMPSVSADAQSSAAVESKTPLIASSSSSSASSSEMARGLVEVSSTSIDGSWGSSTSDPASTVESTMSTRKALAAVLRATTVPVQWGALIGNSDAIAREEVLRLIEAFARESHESRVFLKTPFAPSLLVEARELMGTPSNATVPATPDNINGLVVGRVLAISRSPAEEKESYQEEIRLLKAVKDALMLPMVSAST